MEDILQKVNKSISKSTPIAEGLTSSVIIQSYHYKIYEFSYQNIIYAVKLFKKKDYEKERNNEIQLLKQINSPFVIKLLKNDEKMTILEKFGHQNLLEYLLDNELSPLLIRHIFLQIVSAVWDLYQQGIFHRDLKPENVLINRDYLTIKLCDFGFSTRINQISDRGIGTIGYMAPELLDTNSHNKISGIKVMKADVFALGIILYNLIFRMKPFNNFDKSQQWQYIVNSQWDRFWLNKSQSITQNQRNILEGMLTADPNKRYSFDDIIRSDYIQQNII